MPVEFRLPDLGEGIHEGEIIEVLVKVGDNVLDGQTVLIVETDKATVEVPAPVTGKVEEIRVKAGQMVGVGTVLIVFSREGESLAKAAPEPPLPPAPTPEAHPAPFPKPGEAPAKGPGPVPAAPSTRRLARELGVDLRMVTPSGPGGRVTPEDVRAYSEKAKPEAPKPAVAPMGLSTPVPIRPPAMPQFDALGPVEHVPLRSVRRATAKHLALAWSQVPHVTHMDVADITDLEEFRQRGKQRVERQGGTLSMTSIMLKAVAGALRKFPRFNSSIDMDKEEILLKHYYHIGVAVDTDRGLLVPVIRDVDRKSIPELAIELAQLAEKARQGKTTPEDLSGGTFTITNIGSIGGTAFSPIINYPEVAILGMARARLQPVVMGDLENHAVVARLMLPLIITFDHRVLDGAEAARFLSTIIEALESPENLLMLV